MSNKIYISVVSHYDDKLIIENNVLSVLAKNYTVVLKCNTPASEPLKGYAKQAGIILLDEKYGMGFSQNNNYVFFYCENMLNMTDNDFFLVLNPDLIIEKESLIKLHQRVIDQLPDICTINLYKDISKTQIENSIKRFPSLLTPLITACTGSRPDLYDKSTIDNPINIDWAAGSFLLFQSKHYNMLNGFNEKYFMYFEDVDLCKRAKKNGLKVTYYPDIKATHLGAYTNRNIFSRHFRWYIRSYVRYHFSF